MPSISWQKIQWESFIHRHPKWRKILLAKLVARSTDANHWSLHRNAHTWSNTLSHWFWHHDVKLQFELEFGWRAVGTIQTLAGVVVWASRGRSGYHYRYRSPPDLPPIYSRPTRNRRKPRLNPAAESQEPLQDKRRYHRLQGALLGIGDWLAHPHGSSCCVAHSIGWQWWWLRWNSNSFNNAFQDFTYCKTQRRGTTARRQ